MKGDTQKHYFHIFWLVNPHYLVTLEKVERLNKAHKQVNPISFPLHLLSFTTNVGKHLSLKKLAIGKILARSCKIFKMLQDHVKMLQDLLKILTKILSKC
jgi:hypothetical protein